MLAGSQVSLFHNFAAPVSEEWCQEYLIETKDSEQGPPFDILVGGGSECGVLNLIEKYGFYEGGAGKNPYRIDPEIAIALLTGEVTIGALQAAKQRAEFAISYYSSQAWWDASLIPEP